MSVFKKLGLMLVALLAIAATGLAVSTSANAQPYVQETFTSPPTAAGGQPITITGSGWVPGETITLTLHSDPMVLGTTTADASGDWSVTVTIPTSATCGEHTITATGSATNRAADQPKSESHGITITPPCVQPSVSTTPPSSVSVTGVAAMGIGALGVVLLVGGGVMLLLGRRRKASS